MLTASVGSRVDASPFELVMMVTPLVGSSVGSSLPELIRSVAPDSVPVGLPLSAQELESDKVASEGRIVDSKPSELVMTVVTSLILDSVFWDV